FETDPNFLTYDEVTKRFTGVDSTPATFVRVTNSIGSGSFAPSEFSVKVDKRLGTISINGNGTNSVFVGGARMLLYAQVTNADGTMASPQPAIKWSLAEENDNQYVALTNQSLNTIEVAALKPPSDLGHIVKVIAELAASTPDGTQVDEASFPLFVKGERNIVDFREIKVRIDMLDTRTSKDLFGPVAQKEYHVAKIRIINDLSAPRGGGPASSVIFFSDALEVRVALEKKAKKEGTWAPITADDVYYINNWDTCDEIRLKRDETEKTGIGNEACELIAARDKANCEVEFSATRSVATRQNQITSCKATAELNRLACRREIEIRIKEGNCSDGDLECKYRHRFCAVNQRQLTANQPLKNGQWIPFRPYLYQVVANTHDRRDERSLRSRIFLGANVVASGTSFFTSFLTLGPGSDLPLALDKYQNLLLPAMGKLYPSMKEVYRQNIVSEVLPPLVDLPYGSDVSKHVFFPKKEIDGILPGHYVRIVSVSSHLIESRVGIVHKGHVGPIP
ncbi:MAG TPA: hypothetical protein VNA22_06710, partial [Pyrinomonadaceae bacterium]|nr:hypothetical protein [Pyrinomonadaceae bacterium]